MGQTQAWFPCSPGSVSFRYLEACRGNGAGLGRIPCRFFRLWIPSTPPCHQHCSRRDRSRIVESLRFSQLGYGPLALIMKVAFLNDLIYGYASADAAAVGGNERQQWLLARALASSGWTVYVG